MHQIRRHMSHLRHPVINDRQYGDNKNNRFFSEELNGRGWILPATELRFPHPRSREITCLTARLDADFTQILEQMEWQKAVPLDWRFCPVKGL